VALVRPFHALRPIPDAASAVASVPYDVVSRPEARDLAAGNPLSFLHVSRAEIDLDPDVDAYDDAVYERAAENLETLRAEAPLVVEESASLYCYRLQDGAHEQTGLAGCFSLDEYDKGLVRRHERTRADKEDDRTRHMLAVGAQTGIVFLTYRASTDVTAVTTRVCREEPLFDLTAADGVRHTVWRAGPSDAVAVVEAFGSLPYLYIADGHHRIASAARARDELSRANNHDSGAEACFFLGVAFPDNETRILPYNRTVANLAGLTPAGFVDAVQARFPVQADADPVPAKGQVAVYLDGRWYGVDLRRGVVGGRTSEVSSELDVAVVQDHILNPVLQVADVRTDTRMTFVGGARGTRALEDLVDSGQAAVAFSLAPVTPDELLSVSDAGEIMPPKSTWFEPKLRDGLLSHLI
jgi:uncharacterized protein (DUF1015 family)